MRRLEALGDWLERNGEAIYDTRPAKRAEARTADGTPVRFTRRGETTYAVLLDTPSGIAIEIPNVAGATKAEARLLSGEQAVRSEPAGADGIRLHLDAPLPPDAAHAFALGPVRGA